MAQDVAVKWTFSKNQLARYVKKRAEDKYQAALRAVQNLVPEITAWLKAEAEWIDDTGAARRSLEAVVEETGSGFRVILRGGGITAPHMVFLEFDHAGKYSIVGPGFEYWVPRIAAAVREAVRRA